MGEGWGWGEGPGEGEGEQDGVLVAYELRRERHPKPKPKPNPKPQPRPDLVVDELRGERIALVLAAVHAHGDAQREAADDLLVLRVVRVAEHLLDRLGC